MNKPSPQQQIQLNPLQVIQITGTALSQLQEWLEKKQGTPDDSHPKRTITARNSIFHTRLILGIRQHELLREIAAAQQAAKVAAARTAPQGFLADIVKEMKPLPLEYIDTDTTRKLFEKATTQQGC